MKRIRTADGGLLFLEEDDYMPKLLAYLRESAGNDAADIVEEWVKDQALSYAEAMGRADGARFAAEEKARRLFEEMRDERDEHLREIEELEEELVNLSATKDRLMAVNEYLTDIYDHPEKRFPEIGATVWREIDGKKQIGTITEVSLKKDYRTGKTEFAIIARFGYGNGARYRLSNLGKTIHICAEEGDA